MANFWEPYLDLGKEIEKSLSTESFWFSRWRKGSAHNLPNYTLCSGILSPNPILSEKFEYLTGSLEPPVRVRAVKFFTFVGLLGVFRTKKFLALKILNWGRYQGGPKNRFFPNILIQGYKLQKKPSTTFFKIQLRIALQDYTKIRSIKVCGFCNQNGPPSIFSGAPHPYTPKDSWRGFQRFRALVEHYRKAPEYRRSANCSWGKNQNLVAKDVFFQSSKFCRNWSIYGRDIRGQMKVGFPGPAMKLERT